MGGHLVASVAEINALVEWKCCHRTTSVSHALTKLKPFAACARCAVDNQGDKAVTQLFAVLFFAAVLGTAVAVLWAVLAENLEAVRANMPWKPRQTTPYWATPSISSVTPSRASTVSPATVR
jgi:hypothetical protein